MYERIDVSATSITFNTSPTHVAQNAKHNLESFIKSKLSFKLVLQFSLVMQDL